MIDRILKNRTKKTGSAPGTAVYIGDTRTEPVTIEVITYDPEHYEEKTVDSVDQCAAYTGRPGVTWININGIHQPELIEKAGNLFAIHPLTTEDILNTTQRPKLDIFDDSLFMTIRMNTYNKETKEVENEQVSFILGASYLLTFQVKKGDTFDAVRRRLQENKGRIRKQGPDYLAYALLDSVIDNYFLVLEEIGEEIEQLEEELTGSQTREILHKIHFLKKELMLLRKSVWPLREVISRLQRGELDLISQSITLYINDLYDHTIQIIDTVETYRDMVSGMLEIYLSSISNRMNEIMKVLTMFAAVFIPMTLIAGIYGMNFNSEKSPLNMPELSWHYGYPFALGLMFALGTGIIVVFKRKKWF